MLMVMLDLKDNIGRKSGSSSKEEANDLVLVGRDKLDAGF